MYLDHNATSPLRPGARNAMAAASERMGNPSSVHTAGRAARAVLEEARTAIAALCGVANANVVFTSGGTEADALALWGAALAEPKLTRLIVSAVEHDAVLANAALVAERCHIRLEILPVTRDGVADMVVLEKMLDDGGKALVALMVANNETGAIQPTDTALQLTHAAGGLFFCDAVAGAGKMALPKADYLTLAGHKIGGPLGTGALLVADNAPFAPLIRGGGQEMGRRAGSENLIALAGFGAAARECLADDPVAKGTVRARFEQQLRTQFPDVVIFSAEVPRLWNTTLFALTGMAAENALMALDLDGICVSRGAACSSGKVKRSHVLTAMGVEDALAQSVLRVSFGWSSEEGEADAAVASLLRFMTRIRAAGRVAA